MPIKFETAKWTSILIVEEEVITPTIYQGVASEGL